jgi:hypothetical protein
MRGVGNHRRHRSFGAPAAHARRTFRICTRGLLPGCIVVAGGDNSRKSAEVYDEVLGRWLRLPRDLPNGGCLGCVGSMLV